MSQAEGKSGPDRHSIPFLLLFLILIAFGLRLAAAQGGLWLDEAWSALLAREVSGFSGVFLGINHDNNHHLNSLWLQVVGWDSSPLWARGLSILSGTLAVAVAWRIGSAWARAGAAAAAFLFAVSPILVTYGAEARGYAPMILFLLLAVQLVQRGLETDGLPARLPLALLVLLGMLSHLTMMFGLLALAGAVLFDQVRGEGPGEGVRRSLAAFTPAFITAMAVIVLVLRAGAATPGGFQLGGYEPFDLDAAVDALEQTVAFALGFPDWHVLLVLGPLILVPIALWRWRPRLGIFHLLAILAFPAAVLALGLANSSFARYYLLAAVALLLLCAQGLAALIQAPGWKRALGTMLLAAFALGSLALNLRIIRDRHGDAGEAIALMQAKAPRGSAVFLAGGQGAPVQLRPEIGGGMKRVDVGRDAPVLMAAADQTSYALEIERDPCAGARFLFLSQSPASVPATLVQCESVYHRLELRTLDTLSGAPWALYERQDTPRRVEGQ